jgi:hypothetical protein
MAISDRIAAKITVINQERVARLLNPAAPMPVSTEIQEKAIAAVQGGNTSPAWETYMGVFTNDAGELARMVPLPLGSDPNAERQKARAYLVANGVCGITTTTQLLNEVTTKLD